MESWQDTLTGALEKTEKVLRVWRGRSIESKDSHSKYGRVEREKEMTQLTY